MKRYELIAILAGLVLVNLTFNYDRLPNKVRETMVSTVEAQTTRPIVVRLTTQTTIAATPTRLTDTGTALGVVLKAICPGEVIYLGRNNAVNENTGFVMNDGDMLTIEVNNANQFWAVASSAGQRIAIISYTR